MDQRLLRYYNRELQHLREMGGEFARDFPKIAGRLGLDAFECADPYVERLLEGFAFLAARVQLKIDAEFPRFTQHLFESVYPHYLCQTPSMAIVQLRPDLAEGSLAEGFVVPRGSVLRSQIARGLQTACEYRTAHETRLYPVEIVEAQYYTRDITSLNLNPPAGARAALRLRLRSTANLTFNKINLDELVVYLRGQGEIPMRLYEALFARAMRIVVAPIQRPAKWTETIDKSSIRRVGFREDEALLPRSPRSFEGYRLLTEYFACPERFMFAAFTGLLPAMARCGDSTLDLVIFFNQADQILEGSVDKSFFELHCTPAINLFPKQTDRIHLNEHLAEYHIVPDRTRPMDFEVYQVHEATGYGTSTEAERRFLPFYAANDLSHNRDESAYFALRRMQRVPSQRQRLVGPRSTYAGTETFISLVDATSAPIRTDLRQLALTTTCTNRDLPLHMPVGQGRTDFTLELSAPVESVRCIAGPTRPRPSHVEGQTTWRILSHFSLHYTSLIDHEDGQGAAALRDLLTLYGEASEPAIRKQIEGVHSIKSKPIVRRVTTPGPIAFARGLEISLTFDESAFQGTGVFLLGAVLEQFFARHVSLNAFTETVIRTLEREEIIRWPARTGRRQTL